MLDWVLRTKRLVPARTSPPVGRPGRSAQSRVPRPPTPLQYDARYNITGLCFASPLSLTSAPLLLFCLRASSIVGSVAAKQGECSSSGYRARCLYCHPTHHFILSNETNIPRGNGPAPTLKLSRLSNTVVNVILSSKDFVRRDEAPLLQSLTLARLCLATKLSRFHSWQTLTPDNWDVIHAKQLCHTTTLDAFRGRRQRVTPSLPSTDSDRHRTSLQAVPLHRLQDPDLLATLNRQSHHPTTLLADFITPSYHDP